jgi:hypothetical protein
MRVNTVLRARRGADSFCEGSYETEMDPYLEVNLRRPQIAAIRKAPDTCRRGLVRCLLANVQDGTLRWMLLSNPVSELRRVEV